MNIREIFRFLFLSIVSIIVFQSCQEHKSINKVEGVTVEKRVHPWIVFKDGFTFKNIEPVKDMIGSLSIFGNPPKEFLDDCHKNGIEVYKAVGGSEENINTPEKINLLVDSYLKECENGYDGIDLDFEHLDADFQDQYSVFLKTASIKLHAAGKKMSHCVGFYPELYKNNKAKIFYDLKVLSETCDLVRVMCYDMYFAPGIGKPELIGRDDCTGMGPTANYPWIEKAMLFWKDKIPVEKLVMALPAYGNDYSLTGNMSGNQIYNVVPNNVKGNLPSPIWLCYEKLHVYLYDHVDGNRHLFYASDDKSTKALLELADNLNLPLIGFWHYDSVSEEMWRVTGEWFNR